MKGIFSLLFLLFSFSVYSQTDSLTVVDRISSSQISKSDMISKGRRLLLNDFEAGNKEGVREVIQYFNNHVEDEDHLALWTQERLLLYYWTEDYVELLNLGLYANLDSVQRNTSQSVVPSDDLIAQKVQSRVKNEYEQIVADIESTDFSPDSKEFLLLLLNRLLLVYDSNFISLDEINRRSDEFGKNYPESPLYKIIKENIAFKLQLGDWGLGFTFGGGIPFISGGIVDQVDFAGVLNLSLDAYYKKFYFGLNVNTAFGKLKNDLPIRSGNRIWPQGEELPITMLAPAVGFTAVDYKRLRITPFAGASFNFATPDEQAIEDYPELKGLSIGTSVTPLVGLSVDFALNNPKKINPYGGPSALYTLGIKTMYMPNVITNQGGNMKGQLFVLAFSFKMFIFQVKRVY